MITPEYCRTMARYNTWQNKAIWGVVQKMSDAEANQDRGAFFGSIRATLNHLLWGDQLWLSRFDGGLPPQIEASEHKEMTPNMPAWWAERFRTDGRIRTWADDVSALDLVGELVWYSGIAQREMHKPMGLCVVQFFNHQTHHRGQVHAMLTAAGHKTEDTDLPFMPEE